MPAAPYSRRELHLSPELEEKLERMRQDIWEKKGVRVSVPSLIREILQDFFDENTVAFHREKSREKEPQSENRSS